jgi:integrase
VGHPAHLWEYGGYVARPGWRADCQIADQLGHSDPAMTASVYLGRDLMGDKRSVAEHL